MADEQTSELVLHSFDWDESKNDINRVKHGIDFDDALEVFYGPRPGNANLEFSLPADLLHRLWMNEESTSAAFFGGRIKSKGSLLKASHLIDLFRDIEEIYPAIAAEYQLT